MLITPICETRIEEIQDQLTDPIGFAWELEKKFTLFESNPHHGPIHGIYHGRPSYRAVIGLFVFKDRGERRVVLLYEKDFQERAIGIWMIDEPVDL